LKGGRTGSGQLCGLEERTRDTSKGKELRVAGRRGGRRGGEVERKSRLGFLHETKSLKTQEGENPKNLTYYKVKNFKSRKYASSDAGG